MDGERRMRNEEILAIKNLAAGYGSRHILKDISFSVGQGEMVGLIGANGAGKSTLLKTLRGILPLLEGKILLKGRDIYALPARKFAREVAYLQQHVEVAFGYTAREIVMAGRYPYLRWWERENAADEEIVDACMEYAGVSELAGQTMHSISGGQRQRVLLAKVLAQQTPILFLDEPATGLDVFYQEEIFRFCRELCAAGKTVLMVVHELSLAARFCSRLLLVGQGHILADGTADKVLTAENLTQAYATDVQVVKNPLTGHTEVFTMPEKSDRRKDRLLGIILDGTLSAGTAVNQAELRKYGSA